MHVYSDSASMSLQLQREGKALSGLQITHILRDLLHGWGSILFCVNVSPAALDYDSTAGVLQYAAMATQIGNAARAEAPKRARKAMSPNISKKRKVMLPSTE